MAFAHFLGAGWLMTAWTMSFLVPNLARRLFGEGAASASFIPVYSEQLQENPEQAKRLANTVVTVLFVLLAAVVLIAEAVVWGWYKLSNPSMGPQTGLILCSIMLPYMIFVCTLAILGGILNVHRHFASPAAAPIVLNIFIITSLAITGWVFGIGAQQQVFFIAVAVLFAGLAQIALLIPPLRAGGISIRPAWDVHSAAFRKIILMMGPMVVGLTVTQINTLADHIVAFSFMTEGGYPLGWGSVSHLYYAQRLYQFPLGVLGISLATAIFPVMSAEAAKKDFKSLRRTIARGISATVFVAVPATAGLFLVAKPLVSAVFEHGEFPAEATPIVAGTLVFYAIGLCGYFSQQIMARAFYSMQDSKTPMKSALIAVLVNVILNLTLIWFMGAAGLALSTAICSYLQVCILVIVLRKRLGRSILQGLGGAVGKTFAATVPSLLVGAGVMAACAGLPQSRIFNVLRLVLVVPATAAVYVFAAKLLRIEMLALLTGTGQSD